MTGPILYTAHGITSCLTRALFDIIRSTEIEDAHARNLAGAIVNVAIISKDGKPRIQICILKQSDVRELTFKEFHRIVSRYYGIDVVMPVIEGGMIRFAEVDPATGQEKRRLEWSQPKADPSGDNFKRIFPWVERLLKEGKDGVLLREVAVQGGRFHNAGRSGGRVANLDIVLLESGRVQIIDVKTGLKRPNRKRSTLITEFENRTSIPIKVKYLKAA